MCDDQFIVASDNKFNRSALGQFRRVIIIISSLIVVFYFMCDDQFIVASDNKFNRSALGQFRRVIIIISRSITRGGPKGFSRHQPKSLENGS